MSMTVSMAVTVTVATITIPIIMSGDKSIMRIMHSITGSSLGIQSVDERLFLDLHTDVFDAH